jgi:DNA-binding NarL/FixJ family response regulator
MNPKGRVVVACDDLFFRVNLEGRIRAAGLEPIGVASKKALESALFPSEENGPSTPGAPPPADLPLPRAGIVDLHLRSGEAIAIISRLASLRPGMPILAFGSHVERDTLDQARRAGAVALPRSRFVREFPSLMGKIATGTWTPVQLSSDEPS